MTENSRKVSRRGFVKAGGTLLAGSLASLSISVAKAGPGTADVIVIGAGSFGCNTAWHLSQKGLDVLVLDSAAAPASFTTRGAAGFVSSWSTVHVKQWGKNEWFLQRYGIDFYTRLASDAGTEIGFFPSGITYIYLTTTGWQNVQPRAATARGFGTKLEVLTAARAKSVVPQVDFGSTTGILFDPDSVRVRAGDAIPALARIAARKGVRFQYNTHVKSLLHNEKGLAGVETDSGQLWASAVIVTAGAACRPLVEKSCGPCPAQPEPATRYVTKPIPGITPSMPMLIFSDFHGVYIREERGGLLIGGAEQAEEIRESIRNIEKVMPSLRSADILEITGGLPTYTSDILFILDEIPNCKGIYVIAGCQEGGITHGPGLGKMMAELVVDGRTEWNRDPYRLSRFKA
jgi:glycine/D-amino acid oxidase-like deaminating enzyme